MFIDLRSDTVTHPSPEMRDAMYRAEVGDDVYGEDPTVNRLQELAAEMVGKEAALFVPTGTMGNAIAVLTHTGRGQGVIVGDESHIYHYEAGGPSSLGGSPMFSVPTLPNGMLNIEKLQATIKDDSDPHAAATALLCIENTHNRCGGRVLSPTQVAQLASIAHSRGISIHMDGARVFNAAAALNIPVRELTQLVDSVMFCLSKGLGAPIGSILAGSTEFIRRAHRTRKLLGGGMRQAGIIAAAGIVALEHMVERLAEDHANSQLLAEGLANLPLIDIKPQLVETNIVLFKLHTNLSDPHAETMQFITKAQEHGVLLSSMGGGLIRAVTHYGIEKEHILNALATIKKIS